MNKGILITKAIYELLNVASITTYVGTALFPLVADVDTDFPFIVYSRESVNGSNLTKDGSYGDAVTFRIDIVSNSYSQSIDIAQAVRELLEVRKLYTTELILSDTKMTSIRESYDSETFIQQMYFSTTVTNRAIQQET